MVPFPTPTILVGGNILTFPGRTMISSKRDGMTIVLILTSSVGMTTLMLCLKVDHLYKIHCKMRVPMNEMSTNEGDGMNTTPVGKTSPMLCLEINRL